MWWLNFVSNALVLKKEEYFVKFGKTVEIMQEDSHFSAIGDDAKHQLDDFIDNIAKESFELFSEY